MQMWGQRLLHVDKVISDMLRVVTFICCVCAIAHGGGESVLSDHHVGPEIKLRPLEVRLSGTFIH